MIDFARFVAYIRDFDRVPETATNARELYDQILELYPDRVNPGALWVSARPIKRWSFGRKSRVLEHVTRPRIHLSIGIGSVNVPSASFFLVRRSAAPASVRAS